MRDSRTVVFVDSSRSSADIYLDILLALIADFNTISIPIPLS